MSSVCPVECMYILRIRTYRCYFAISDRVIRTAGVTRGEIRFTVGTTDWTEFVPIAVAGSLAGRLEAGYSVRVKLNVSINFRL